MLASLLGFVASLVAHCPAAQRSMLVPHLFASKAQSLDKWGQQPPSDTLNPANPAGHSFAAGGGGVAEAQAVADTVEAAAVAACRQAASGGNSSGLLHHMMQFVTSNGRRSDKAVSSERGSGWGRVGGKASMSALLVLCCCGLQTLSLHGECRAAMLKVCPWHPLATRKKAYETAPCRMSLFI